MAYQIDFTASYYNRRKWRKHFLRALLLASLGGAAWGAYDVYTTYKEPTLNMKLLGYEAAARPIEEVNAAWDAASQEYGAMVRYYRLVWAANPTNFLTAMAAAGVPHWGRGCSPRNLTLKTGGDCRLNLRYVFGPGDKAVQTKGLEDKLAQAVTSIVQVVGGKVEVQGVPHENLLGVETFDVAVRFALPGVMSFPSKERTLTECVNEIAAMRKKVHETKFAGRGGMNAPSTARDVMMAYLMMGRDKPDFPNFSATLNVAGWFGHADQFIMRNRIPGDDDDRKRLKAVWNKIGEARFPWQRFRALDNDALVQRTKILATVAEGASRFKVFLERRRADNRRRLAPFADAYDRGDIFNKPLVETDLRDRVAAAAGISGVGVEFRDEQGAEPLVFKKDGDRFTFTWVRWTLSVSAGATRHGENEPSSSSADAGKALTFGCLADCIHRILTLGPGYALDSVKIDFDADGNVAHAALDGLLPVKKVEPAKEAKK